MVVDASVAVKWVLREPHSANALHLLRTSSLLAPSHWLAEVVNTLWAKVRFGDASVAEASSRVRWLTGAPVESVPIPPLMEAAFAISTKHRITVYDSLYIALALDRGVPLVTADVRLLRSVTDERLRPFLQWIGDTDPAG